MTARLDLPTVVDQALDGERRARRLLRCWKDGMPTGADAMLHELQDIALEHGRAFAPSPAIRAFCRAIQKTLEGRTS
jgi:hypothetical protein